MRRVSSTGHETYIPAEDNPSTPRDATLVKEVIAEAQKIVDMGYNAKIGCINKKHQEVYEAHEKNLPEGYVVNTSGGELYDLACKVVAEAKKIVNMGYNAKIGCLDAEPDKSEREKRKAYYKWKRMNRS